MPEFNKEQQKAINFKDGAFLCIAGPGSGKTTVIINRAKSLVESGVNPYSILTVTFTKAAAEEMKSRYENLDRAIKGPMFLTIHSICFKIISQAYGYSARNIINSYQQYMFFKNTIDELEIGDVLDIKRLIKAVILDISKVENGEENREDYVPDSIRDSVVFWNIYDKYKDYKRRNCLIDYDDMLNIAAVVLNNEQWLAYWRKIFQYVMIDEFQDTNFLQAKILYALAAPLNNIFVVGDDDQSIYGFRGARPDIMLDFEQKFKGVKKAYLTVNYRSEKDVIDKASKLINNNQIRFDKEINGNKEDVGVVKVLQTEFQENMLELLEKEVLKMKNKGTPYNEMAVLCRTNALVSKIAKYFSDNEIPFYSPDALENIHENWIFKTLRSYINIGLGINEENEIISIVNKPSRFIKKELIVKFKGDLNAFKNFTEEEYNKKTERKDRQRAMLLNRNVSDFYFEVKRLKRNSDLKAEKYINYIIHNTEFLRYIKEYCEWAKLDFEEYKEILNTIIEEAAPFKTTKEWLDYVDEQDLTFKQKMEGNYDGVTISTMHKAKGLEWDEVFVMGCNHGQIPYIHKNNEGKDECDIEEERRLMYVAITRARKHCYLMRNTQKKDYVDNKKSKEKPSEFLEEIFEENNGKMEKAG